MKMGKGDRSDKNPKAQEQPEDGGNEGFYGYVPYVPDELILNPRVGLMTEYQQTQLENLRNLNERVTVSQNDNGSIIIHKSPQNHSNVSCPAEQLEILVGEGKIVPKGEGSDDVTFSSDAEDPCNNWNLRAYIVLGILLLTNLLNYIDRYTIAGVLVQVKDFYQVESDAMLGLIQTTFIVSYMLLSPVFGYLGDRYNRKVIMASGILFWSLVTLAGSFVPQHYFPVFLLLRAMVGVGEASYSTIAPTLIADLFVKNMRTKALSVFYFAIPVGSGMGYIVGSNVAKAFGHWQWALRVTPVFGILCVILILVVVREPKRGAAEGAAHLHSTSWGEDLAYLVRNKSYMLTTFGFTCVSFVAGALSLWAPTYVYYSILVKPGSSVPEEASVSLIFGVITCAAGVTGVVSGTVIASKLRSRYPNVDPLVCGVGLIASAPFLFLSIFLSRHNTLATWLLIFVGETLLSLNWALVTDIVLYIVIPTRRSTAEALQIIVCHALGDAGSPYLVGVVSDAIAQSRGATGFTVEKYITLQYSMYMTCFVCVLGGAFFLLTSVFITDDREKADQITRASQSAATLTTNSSQTTTVAPTPTASQPCFPIADDDADNLLPCNNDVDNTEKPRFVTGDVPS